MNTHIHLNQDEPGEIILTCIKFISSSDAEVCIKKMTRNIKKR